jgi:hypothetical protein
MKYLYGLRTYLMIFINVTFKTLKWHLSYDIFLDFCINLLWYLKWHKVLLQLKLDIYPMIFKMTLIIIIKELLQLKFDAE